MNEYENVNNGAGKPEATATPEKKENIVKEFFRKRIVGLKRNTQIIPLIFLIVSCCIFTFALGTHSVAANGNNYSVQMENNYVANGGQPVSFLTRSVGLYVFIITLFSVLSVISYLSVYKKGKLNIPMLVVVYFMLAAMIVCNLLYVDALKFYMYDFGSREPTDEHMLGAIANSTAHVVSLIVSVAFVSILPLIRWLLNKIDTSVDDEYDKLIDSESDEEMMIEIDEQA